MIINTGNRTDIPAFYAEWFLNRLREGYVCARNPYRPDQVTRFRLNPAVVDLLAFCTKDPAPLLTLSDRRPDAAASLGAFRQFWFVTITPYGREIEPGVPDRFTVMDSFRELSRRVGTARIVWRYDPVFLSEEYSLEFHLRVFEEMAAYLEGYTEQVVVSFIDLYEKTKRNFPEVLEVRRADRLMLGEAFCGAARRHGMRLHTCLEGNELARFGADTTGCMTKEVIERALEEELRVPPGTAPAREGCRCLLGSDVGAYNTCRHFCRYCYANYDREAVLLNTRAHDPSSPLLIGRIGPDDEVREARQESWLTGQMKLF